jgi:hypothetical protein
VFDLPNTIEEKRGGGACCVSTHMWWVFAYMMLNRISQVGYVEVVVYSLQPISINYGIGSWGASVVKCSKKRNKMYQYTKII